MLCQVPVSIHVCVHDDLSKLGVNQQNHGHTVYIGIRRYPNYQNIHLMTDQLSSSFPAKERGGGGGK